MRFSSELLTIFYKYLLTTSWQSTVRKQEKIKWPLSKHCQRRCNCGWLIITSSFRINCVDNRSLEVKFGISKLGDQLEECILLRAIIFNICTLHMYQNIWGKMVGYNLNIFIWFVIYNYPWIINRNSMILREKFCWGFKDPINLIIFQNTLKNNLI